MCAALLRRPSHAHIVGRLEVPLQGYDMISIIYMTALREDLKLRECRSLTGAPHTRAMPPHTDETCMHDMCQFTSSTVCAFQAMHRDPDAEACEPGTLPPVVPIDASDGAVAVPASPWRLAPPGFAGIPA